MTWLAAVQPQPCMVVMGHGPACMCSLHIEGVAAHLCHEAEVQDADLALRRADEIARVGVSMQETCLQQLNEVAVQQGGAQLPDITGCTLTQLLPCTRISLPFTCRFGCVQFVTL